MSLFKKAEMQAAYLKMGIYGEAGTGKTYSASLIARGLALHIEKLGHPKPSVMFFDTETGANWVKPIFDEAGIEFLVASTRAFSDLKLAVSEAESSGAILICDSLSHVWEEVREAYLTAKRKRLKNPHARLELPDWNVIKPEWGKFTTQFLNSACHIILCGRAGTTYEFQDREEDGRKEMIASGTRMAAEKAASHEPNLLVEMTSKQITGPRKAKTITRTATVLKDRSTTLDGRQFENPKFDHFLPHIKKLNLGGAHAGFDTTRTSSALFPKEERDDTYFDRTIIVEKIQALLVKHYPSTGLQDKAAKAGLVETFMGTRSWTEVEKKMPLHELRERYNALHKHLEKKPSEYFPDVPEMDDEIPAFNGEKSPLRVKTDEKQIDIEDAIQGAAS